METIQVLVVEDDGDTADYIAASLTRWDDPCLKFEVTEAHDGLQGLQLLHERKFDLAIVDMLMPKVLGAELIALLRRHDGPNKGVPIVILTGFPDLYLQELHEPQYINVLPLDKPFELSKLQRNVRIALGMRGKIGAAPVPAS